MTVRRVLLVDDEPMVLRVLKMTLERAGYSVETRGNGEQALTAIAENPPDAMISDVEMPVMSGQELCMRISELYPDRDWPIFVATSLTGSEHREWSSRIDNLYFLEKPLSARRLLEVIHGHFADSGELVADRD